MSRGSTHVDPSQHNIKVIIIIILKLDSKVNPGQGLSHGPRGSTWVNVRIKVVIIIILKLDSRVDRGKAQVTSQKGPHELT